MRLLPDAAFLYSVFMKAFKIFLTGAVLFAAVFPIWSDNLGDILRESNWDRMIGTWVDEETHGSMATSVTSWRFEDHVLESITMDHQGKEEISLMIYNSKRSKVYHVSADSMGGSTSGEWTLTEDEAILNLGYVNADRQEGRLKIRYAFLDDDTMTIIFYLPEPVIFRMVRLTQ